MPIQINTNIAATSEDSLHAQNWADESTGKKTLFLELIIAFLCILMVSDGIDDQFKAKYIEIKPQSLCLGNTLKHLTLDNMKQDYEEG